MTIAANHGEWCILRTAPARTLPLTRSLLAAGLDAWTPTQIVTRRVPRSKVKRTTEAPFTPTYVFVRALHLNELRRLSALPTHRHPAFSIFRHFGSTVRISERSIEGLRKAEAESQRRANAAAVKLRRKRDGEPYRAGETITPTSGPFAGLSGTIRESNGRHTLVLFGTVLEVKIGTSFLREDAIAIAGVAA